MATISRDEMQKILKNAPAGADKAQLIKTLQSRGHSIEGLPAMSQDEVRSTVMNSDAFKNPQVSTPPSMQDVYNQNNQPPKPIFSNSSVTASPSLTPKPAQSFGEYSRNLVKDVKDPMAGVDFGNPMNYLPNVGNALSSFGNSLWGGVTSAASGVSNIVQSVPTATEGFLNQAYGAITGDQNRSQMGNKQLDTAANQLYKGGTDAVAGSLQGLFSPVAGAFGAIPDAARKPFENSIGNVMQVGKSGLEGLGIDTNNEYLQGTGKNLMSLIQMGGIAKNPEAFAQYMDSTWNPALKLTGKAAVATGKFIGDTAKKAGQGTISSVYGLTPKTQGTLYANNPYMAAAKEGKFNTQTFTQDVVGRLKGRLDDLSSTGKAYDTIRDNPTVTAQLPGDVIKDTLQSKFKLGISDDGTIFSSVNAKGALKPADIARLQYPYDLFKEAVGQLDDTGKATLTGNQFLNIRQALDDASAWDAGVNVKRVADIAKVLRHELDQYAPTSIKTLDALYAPEVKILKGEVRPYLLDPKGNIKDNAESFLSNLGNSNKTQQFQKIAQIVPDLQNQVDAISALKNIEQATNIYGGGSAAVKRLAATIGGASAGAPGGPLGSAAGAIAGGIVSDPKIMADVISKIGSLRNKMPAASAFTGSADDAAAAGASTMGGSWTPPPGGAPVAPGGMAGSPTLLNEVGTTPMAPDILAKAADLTSKNGGVTITLKGDIPTTGYVYSPSKLTETIIPAAKFSQSNISDFVKTHSAALKQPGNHLGIWKDGDNIYLDVSKVDIDPVSAVTGAKAADQLGIFNLDNFETIYAKDYKKLARSAAVGGKK